MVGNATGATGYDAPRQSRELASLNIFSIFVTFDTFHSWQITNQIGWTARLDEDDEWWKPREHLELLCMQPKNDYFGSQIVAGRCKKHNSKQQWEIVGEKVRKAEQ